MIATALIYATSLYFFYFLWNFGEILSTQREFVMQRLPDGIRKMLTCPFCFGFWFSLINLFSAPYLVLCVPVIVMFLEKLRLFLS